MSRVKKGDLVRFVCPISSMTVAIGDLGVAMRCSSSVVQGFSSIVQVTHLKTMEDVYGVDQFKLELVYRKEAVG